MPSCSPTASPAPSPISSASAARQLLARLALPEPWQGTLEASLRLIDELDREIGDCERELRRLGADHRYLPLLCTVPGISWVLADTIAAELGDIDHFPTPRNLRWALVEAATHACTHRVFRDRYQHTKARIGQPRRANVAQVALPRQLA